MAIKSIIMWFVLVGMSVMSMVLVSSADPPAAAQTGATTISCSMVGLELTPCVGYLVYGVSPSGDCCSGATSLYDRAGRDKSNRQAICYCLKSFMSTGAVTQPMIDNFAGLPGKCGIQLPYQLSPNTDCSGI